MVGKEINQVAEFVSAVVRSLPRDLNPTTAQGWIQNQAALAKALYKALRMAYHLVVDLCPVHPADDCVWSLRLGQQRHREELLG